MATIALIGNPNTGKTSLFNQLCGLRAKTANVPGSTVEAHIGRFELDGQTVQLMDLPGLYSLSIDRPESDITRTYLEGDATLGAQPDAVLLVLDGTNLQRNLALAREILAIGLPTVIAVNMADLAVKLGMTIDADALANALGCPVVLTSARGGVGFDDLTDALQEVLREDTLSEVTQGAPAFDPSAPGWARSVYEDAVRENPTTRQKSERRTDALDRVLTHPLWGLLIFAGLMTGLFYAIFSLASLPMDLIELSFGTAGDWLRTVLPEGAIADLAVDGIVGGLAGTLVFLPQICLLFFLISLLEDTGYLARAVLLLDRILGRFGLPGQAFVPLLSAHACAIPAIMSTRLIADRRDRLAAVLIIPFMSCSARLPVYVLLVGILFPDAPLKAGLAFTSCYVLGAVVGLLTAWLTRRTILPGQSPAMIIELPTYKLPSLRDALLMTYEKGMMFLRKAGTVILCMCIVLWWLSAYPNPSLDHQVAALETEAAEVQSLDGALAEQYREDAALLQNHEREGLDGTAAVSEASHLLIERAAVEHSFIGRAGQIAQPAFAPMGLDWQLTVGVMTSFAAREVFVSTLAIIFAGTDDTEEAGVIERITTATRADGSPVFTLPVTGAMLVFYVLAMQCLPTLAVTAREAGGWKWAWLQLGYMTAVAYGLAVLTYWLMAGLAA